MTTLDNTLMDAVQPLAQYLLQQRVDGQLPDVSPISVMAAIYPIQPKMGLTMPEVTNLMQFCMQLEPCQFLPPARELAKKYGLTITV